MLKAHAPAQVGCIKRDKSARVQPKNPYRRILSRDYPEPLIALLAFLFGIWLWDHYFGETLGYPPGTTEVAMVKIDRDLRLADAMELDPAWLRWLAGVDTPAEVRKDALTIFRKLGAGKSFGQPVFEAYSVVSAIDQHQSILQSMGNQLGPDQVPQFALIADDLAAFRGSWWEAKLMEEAPVSFAEPLWKRRYEEGLARLRTRAIITRSVVWLLGLAGLAFLPQTLRCLSKSTRNRVQGYAAAWRPTLGLTVFLVAALAWVGFTTVLNFGIVAVHGLPPLAATAIDAAARLLPAMIALALLFKRPSHAARVLGAEKPVLPAIVLGLFALLLLADQLLMRWLGNASTVSPGGGLNLSEAGFSGLVYAIVSACLLAPLTEEILFRGVLFRSLANRLPVLVAAMISATVFALIHFYNPYGLISVGIFGFACALLYSATGSLTSVITLHLLYNSVVKIPQWIVYHAPTSGFLDRWPG
ncbi:CPBP family intramembrane metalloprotease [Luteolibacter pohnpeiensis]|uniref:CPBP family intramembrane metalloprotease n=1 Tax=Luteolibacter pohnpeiensis TaxID=454153 RepID=A0A934S4M3_9BACT|nr:type II CAAX endopeptidase family protein [Luteolibacter pohnpeiensis]MBK1881818.1 CPBP family intramembrane metalloprotease [Luteolibacter pohnpeiensis]